MNDFKYFVFDTNVLVSALIFENSKPGLAFRLALESGQVFLSVPVLEELNDVLSRGKFQRYILSDDREVFLEAFIDRTVIIDTVEQILDCRDPKDNKFLELAVSGKADCIVSGDDDLLILNPFRGIEILSPDEFLKRF
jgi:putative PIN family toxin of toxin-antitoxin system